MTANLPYRKITLLSAAGLIGLAAFAVSTQAQENTTQAATEDIGIQVSSPIYNFGIDPGGSAQDIVKLRNVSKSTQTFYAEVFDFKPIGETGAPEFLINQKNETYTYSLASWVNISRTGITLKPNESAALNFTINVPKGAEPGGRYAGILFGTSPPKPKGGEIAISNKVGSIILVRITGDAKELASLEEFSTPNNFYEYPPVEFTVRVKNTGNVHVVPKGTIDIKNMFGRSVASLGVNENNGNVLPDSIRKFDKDNDNLVWESGRLTIGRYTANLLLTYGEGTSKQVTGSVTFWVIPWKLLIVVVLSLIVIILLIIYFIKKYNRWVIESAERKKTQESSGGGSTESNQNDPPSQNSPPAQ